MKARKINLRPYKVESRAVSAIMMKVLNTPGVVAALRESDQWSSVEINNLVARRPVEQDYAVKESLATILLHPNLRLTGQQLFDRRMLYEKIKNESNELLLEKSDYEMLKDAVARFTGGGPNEMEMLARVFEAEEIEMEEKKKGK